jgi:hypothetical protein
VAGESSNSTADIWVWLRDFEKDCNVQLRVLIEEFDSPLVSQAFPRITGNVEELPQRVIELFRKYDTPSETVRSFKRRWPATYLIYIADATYRLYNRSETELYPNVASELGINAQTVSTRVIDAFITLLQRYGFRTLSEDKAHFYKLYTALLHSGMPANVWSVIWKNTLLPLAKDVRSNYEAYSGADIRRLALDPDSKYYVVGKDAMQLIENAPAEQINELLAEAFKLSEEVSRKTGRASVFKRHGLPEAAMDGLERELRRIAQSSGGSYGYGRTATARATPRTVFNEAELLLDPSNPSNPLIVSVPEQVFYGDVFSTIVYRYSVNGQEPQDCVSHSLGSKYVVPKAQLIVIPAEHYDFKVELISRSTDENGNCKDDLLNTIHHKWSPINEGLLEFILTSDKQFHLRRKRTRLAQESTLAFLLLNNWSIDDTVDFAIQTSIELYDAWSDYQIVLAKVQPGCSCSILDSRGNQVVLWQETYSVDWHKQRILGETDDGAELYGALLSNLVIYSSDKGMTTSDFEFECVCDGSTVSLDRRLEPGSGVVVNFNKANFPQVIVDGKVTVRIRSTMRVLTSLRFSRMPIKSLYLASIKGSIPNLVGEYHATVFHACTFLHGDVAQCVEENEEIVFDELLIEEKSYFSIGMDGRHLEGFFFVAGISVDWDFGINNETREILNKPITLYDFGNSVYSLKLKIDPIGQRPARELFLTARQPDASYGCPLWAQRLTRPLTVTIPVLQSLLDNNPSGIYSEILCTLSLGYGYAGDWIDLPLLRITWSFGRLYPKSWCNDRPLKAA